MKRLSKLGLGIIFPALFLSTSCGMYSQRVDDSKLVCSITKSTMPAFYNVTLNATNEDMEKAGFDYGDLVNVKVEKNGEVKKQYDVAYVTNYNEVGSFNKSLCDYEAKGNKINISPGLDNKGFDDTCFEGGTCTITMKKKQGYAKTRNTAQVTTKLTYEECGRNNSKYSNSRDVCQIGEIGSKLNSGLLYRGSSPFNKSKNVDRWQYADNVMKYFNVNSEISVSISYEKLAPLMEELTTQYTKTLYNTKDDVIAHKKFMTENLGSDFFDTATGKGGDMVANIFKYIGRRIEAYNNDKENADKPVFFLHCDEGKDRTGFLIMILEAMVGVEYKDLVADFMETFLNYYNISEINNPEKYNTMANLTCYRMLYSFLMPVDTSKGEKRIDKLGAIDFYNFDAKAECEKLIKNGGNSFIQERAENYLREIIKEETGEGALTADQYITLIENYLSLVPPNK